MAYDRAIAECVRELLHDRAGFSERKMFGGGVLHVAREYVLRRGWNRPCFASRR